MNKKLKISLIVAILVSTILLVHIYDVMTTPAYPGTINEVWVQPPFSEASYVIGKYNSTYYYAKNGTTGKYDYLGTNASQIINTALGATPTYGTTLAKGDITINNPIIIPQTTTLQLMGSITKGSSFSGDGLVVLGGSYSKLIATGSAIDCVNNAIGIAGIICTGWSVQGQSIIGGRVLYADIGVLVQGIDGHAQYTGDLINVEAYLCTTGFKFNSTQIHDWVLDGCDAWDTYTYAIDVSNNGVVQLTVYGGEFATLLSGVAGLHILGSHCSFYDLWLECEGGWAADIAPEAVCTRLVGLHIPSTVIRDLGSNTLIDLDAPIVDRLFDDFVGIDTKWTPSVTGTGAISSPTVFGYYGIVTLATGATSASTAKLYSSSAFCQATGYGPTIEVRARLTSITDVVATIDLYSSDIRRVGFVFDSASSANWTARCGDGTLANVDTGVVADTTFHTFKIQTFADAAYFVIDGVLVATITTHLPIGYSLFILFSIENSNIADKHLDVNSILGYWIPVYS